jgi:DNA-binding MarR family transcriptional regulator
METPGLTREILIHNAIQKFWQTLPGIWHNVRAHTRQMVLDADRVSMPQFAILRAISFGKTSVSQLAEEGRISRPAVSRQVDALVKCGLVSRHEDPRDRRHVELALTAQGDELVKSVFADTSSWMKSRMDGLDEEKLQVIMQSLDLLKQVFSGEDD